MQTRILSNVVVAAAIIGGTACAKPLQPSAASENTPPAPATTGTDKLALELDGQRVEITLPAAWKMVEEQSEPNAGLVAFAPGSATPDRTESLFLDGSRAAAWPASLDDAASRALATDDCDAQGACSELGRASSPNGGLLVSIKRPHGVFVASWHRGESGRVVRCGAESSDRDASSETTWMRDAAAIARARSAGEALCSSVKLLP